MVRTSVWAVVARCVLAVAVLAGCTTDDPDDAGPLDAGPGALDSGPGVDGGDPVDGGADVDGGGNVDGSIDAGVRAYRWLRIYDFTSAVRDDHGADIDGIVHDDGATERPGATIARCSIGPVPDPARSDCDAALGAADATGMRFCEDTDTGFVSLGGNGGFVVFELEVPFEVGHTVRVFECGGGDPSDFSVAVATDPDAAEVDWIPLDAEETDLTLFGSMFLPAP